MNEIERSLEEAKLDLMMLQNYGQLSDDDINQINTALNYEVIGPFGDLENPDENVTLPAELILKLRKEIDERIMQFHATEDYANALSAYSSGDQDRLVDSIPAIFPGASYCHSELSQTLYHGISAWPGATPDEYIDHIQRIQTEGILASPHGLHHSMDNIIRAIYNVIDPELTYGPMFFSFKPKEAEVKVFNPHFNGERLVYTPKLETKIALHLKAKWNNRNSEDRVIDDPDGFIQLLLKALSRRGIHYTLSEPTGFLEKYWNTEAVLLDTIPDCC